MLPYKPLLTPPPVPAAFKRSRLAQLLLASALVPLAIGGCSTIKNTPPEKRFEEAVKCLAPGAFIGGGLGAINDGETAALGAVGGALINGLVCAVIAAESDADGDGVSDGLDRCPETPKGMKVDKDGCPVDSDGDGVPDTLDECPGTPAGFKVDPKGCPLDADGDGVLNGLDKCPDTPPGAKVDKSGCSEVGEPLVVLMGINFTFDSSAILEESKFKLASTVQVLVSHPKMRVKIIGHTDSIGTDEYNLGLSKRRAQAVLEYLIAQGVEGNRLETDGKGESEHVAPNTTNAERMKNRRVVFMVLEK